jgi:hypothetical protein
MGACDMAILRRGGLLLPVLVCSNLGCDGLVGLRHLVLSISNQTTAPSDGEDDANRSKLDQSIAEACQYVEGHLVPDALTRLLEEHLGDLEIVSHTCEQFCWPLFCWKKASQLNPDIREDICVRFIEDLATDYPSDEHRDFLEGHEFDCLSGMPQLIY